MGVSDGSIMGFLPTGEDEARAHVQAIGDQVTVGPKFDGAVHEERHLVDRRELPSGRLLLVYRGSDPAAEELELRAPDGEVEVRILCGPDGPQVVVRATRLEVDSPALAVRCSEFDLQAGNVAVRSEGELRVQTVGDVHMNGAVIRLNCTPTDDS